MEEEKESTIFTRLKEASERDQMEDYRRLGLTQEQIIAREEYIRHVAKRFIDRLLSGDFPKKERDDEWT